MTIKPMVWNPSPKEEEKEDQKVFFRLRQVAEGVVLECGNEREMKKENVWGVLMIGVDGKLIRCWNIGGSSGLDRDELGRIKEQL